MNAHSDFYGLSHRTLGMFRKMTRGEFRALYYIFGQVKMHDFIAYLTQDQVAKGAELSRHSVQRAYRFLINSNAMTLAGRSRLAINPAFMFKGRFAYVDENQKHYDALRERYYKPLTDDGKVQSDIEERTKFDLEEMRRGRDGDEVEEFSETPLSSFEEIAFGEPMVIDDEEFCR